MGFGYNVGWGKGMDPKVNAQRSETFSQREEKRLEYKVGLWNVIPSRTPVPLSCVPTLI